MNKTSFIFTHVADWLKEDLEEPKTWLSKVRGYKGRTATEIRKEGISFRLVDSDYEWYFTGKILGDDNELLPVDMYGESYGCVTLQMKDNRGVWIDVN